MSNYNPNPNLLFAGRRNYFDRNIKTAIFSSSASSIFVGGLIFFSVLLYAGENVWTEAGIVAAIFIFGGISSFRLGYAEESEIKQLLTPFLLLAVYSFAQGFLTLFVLNEKISVSAAMPYSYEWSASFWCALKFLALAVFIKLLLGNFRAGFRFLIWILVFTGNFFAVLGIVRFLLQAAFPDLTGWFILPELRPGIGFGTFINQNHFAFLMLMNLGLNGGLCAYGGLEKPLRLLLFVFSILTWIAIVLTASRGGIISSFVVAAVLIFMSFAAPDKHKSRFSKNKLTLKTFSLAKNLAAIAALAVLLIFGIVLIGQDRVLQRFEEIPNQFENVGSAEGFSRLEVWRASAAMIGDHWLFGVGFGGFRYAVSPYIDISGAVAPEQAHNDYLELAASGGLFAALCGIWFLYKFFSVLRQRFSAPASRFENAARIGAVCAFAGIAVHSFFDFGLQLIANWLFGAALLSVAVYKKDVEDKQKDERTSTKNFRRILSFSTQIILLLCLSCSSLVFGYSRLENWFAKKATSPSFIQAEYPKFPFDSHFYETKAFINENLGNREAAAENLKQAIDYRPKDYALQQKIGKIRAAQNQNEAAENAFLRAIELAPRYGEPRFEYGKFLVAVNRKAEGFEQLRFAFRRNPKYFNEVLALAWRESGGKAAETIGLLSPLIARETEKLAAFLLDKMEYSALAGLVCRAEDLTEQQRGELVTKLFEKRRLIYADQIFQRNCGSIDPGTASLADGDFETGELREGLGFGWRTGNLPDTVRYGFDNTTAASRRASLGFIFNGNIEPSLPLVSQTVVVEKNHQYQLSFSYRTEKITSGGLPVLQLILKQPETDTMFEEIRIPENTGGWVKSTIMIQTGKQTEALEIRLSRQPCGQSLCPIFGRLWLDDFVLK